MSKDNIESPRRIYLFSGHMVDRDNRKQARFPNTPQHIKIVKNEIRKILDQEGVGSADLALCGGACGGDLLFSEAVLERDCKLEIRLPFKEMVFLKNSVNFAGQEWLDLYYKVKANQNTKILVLADEPGEVSQKIDSYERNNLWQLSTVLDYDLDKVTFICLWNGEEGDGRGGTKHMYDVIRNKSENVYWLDTTKLW